MREILFRGKKTWDGLWVYGMPTYTYDMSGSRDKSIQAIIQSGNIVESMVNPFTFGQYTGLKDKNGNKIFEGDIVKYYDWYDIKHDDDPEHEENGELGKVTYNNEEAYFDAGYIMLSEVALWTAEIIGNIHDNPELLKGEREWK